MSQDLERLDRINCVVEQIHQTWNNRLEFPIAKIPERYIGHQYAVALKVACDLGGVKFRMLPLVTFDDGSHFAREEYRSCRKIDNKFSVLIDDVEIMDDTQGIIKRVGGIIRLKSFDKAEDIRVLDEFYFSFVFSAVVRIRGPFLEDRKVNPSVFLRSSDREVPRNMVKTGSKMVDDFSGEHAESWRDNAILVVLNSLKERLAIVLREDRVIAFIKKGGDFAIEIEDVLFGPS